MGELNQLDLLFYMAKHGCKVFFETGTGMGTGLSFAKKYPFNILISTEINKELYEGNLHLLKDGRVKLLNMDSVSGIKRISGLFVDTSILFWLDAHFPGADFGKGKYDDPMDEDIRLPLKKELETIKSTRHNKDVIIIDDLRLLEDGNYELGNLPDRKKYGYNGIGFIEDMFGKTHTINRNFKHQGFLILEPK